jgi:peptide deformylase
MALRTIRTFPDPVLKKKSAPVDRITADIVGLLDDMAETMYAANGVGLAAPQVGHSVRAIVVDADREHRGEYVHKLINPRIVDRRGTIEFEEGCLSLPDLVVKVTRAKEVRVEAMLPDGSTTVIEADDLFSIALQHEIDHLDGILLTDRLSSLKRNRYKQKRLKELEEARVA